MKKYLMMSASALAMGAMFVSCGNDDVSASDYYKATYDQKFVEVFGQPSADQDWGFSAIGSTRATRSNPGDTYPATHHYADGGVNANANEWADPNKEFGGWVVPDPLTAGQKLRVQMYFQANPNLSYEDPHFRHFFVQQVYKGKTAPGANSTEEVVAADGSKYTSSNMNLLTVGQSNMHINNFNGGTCSTNNTVLDNGGDVNNGPFHSDEIMLMVNIDDTSCFGYHDSGSSNEEGTTNHNNKAALVSAATIDAWAAANGNPGEAVVDKWNRSFMGFDLAIKEGAQAYEKDGSGNVVYATYNQAAESPQYAWDGENIIRIANQSAETGWQIVYNEGYQNIMGCGWLTTNKNFYIAADQVAMPQTLSVNRAQASTLVNNIQNAPVLKDVMVGDTYYQSVINLPRIKQLVDDGYVPVNNKSLTEWVKVGVSDGYFSDWIVTLTEAKRIGQSIIVPGEPTKKSLRIMAEDVSASDASDFDFNDVVFDVEAEYPEGTTEVSKVKITLWAAGGTLPLKINSVNGSNGVEVHDKLTTATNTMTNTHGQAYADNKNWFAEDNKPLWSDEITLAEGKTISKDNFEADVNQNLRVEVEKTPGNWILLTAQRGQPACKIACPVGTPWALEKHNMNNAFTNFTAWVKTSNPANWYATKVNAQIYNGGVSTTYGMFE